MKAISQKARKVMEKLVAGLDSTTSHRKVQNSPSFMAVCVELVGDTRLGPEFSVAHYYEQNGDLMADPEMTFVRAYDGNFYPTSFKQDAIGMYQPSYQISEDGKSDRANLRQQAEQASFANTWMENIKFQQKI